MESNFINPQTLDSLRALAGDSTEQRLEALQDNDEKIATFIEDTVRYLEAEIQERTANVAAIAIRQQDLFQAEALLRHKLAEQARLIKRAFVIAGVALGASLGLAVSLWLK